MNLFEELFYGFGLIFGPFISLMGFIGSAVALGADPLNPDHTGSAVMFAVGVVFLIVAALCHYALYGRKDKSS